MTKKNIILSISALLYFIFGFIIIFSPSKTLNNLSLVIPIITIALGLIGIYSFLYNKEYKQKQYFNLASGIVNLWLGLITLNNYSLFIDIIPFVISVCSIIFMITFIIESYQSKNNYYKPIIAFLAAITIILTLRFLTVITTKLSGLFLILISFYIITFVALTLTQKPKRKKKTKSKKK